MGVPLVNWGIRRGYAKHGTETLPQDLLVGIIPKSQQKESAGELTMHSGNIDTLAFQAALIGLVYVLTYGFIILFGKFLPPDAASILWGFFFFFGMLIALLIRLLMGKIGIDHLVDVELLVVLRISCHLHGLCVEPPHQALEEKAAEHQKNCDGHVGNRRGEISLDFFFAYSPYVTHCSTSPETILR